MADNHQRSGCRFISNMTVLELSRVHSSELEEKFGVSRLPLRPMADAPPE